MIEIKKVVKWVRYSIRKVTRKWLRWSYHRCVKYVKHVARRIRKHKFHFRIRVKFTNKKLRKCVRKSVRRMILVIRRKCYKIKSYVRLVLKKLNVKKSHRKYILRRVRKILRKYKKIIKRKVRAIIRKA